MNSKNTTPVRANAINVLLQIKGEQKSHLEQIPESSSGANKPPSSSDPAPGCSCRKSQCLKLYCACFAAKTVCCSTCNCLNCANVATNVTGRQDAVKQILDRNPTAFDSKFKTDATHKTGCRCRKSQCLKKYCECFQAGVICNAICTCLQCANDGSGRPAAIIPKTRPTDVSFRSTSPLPRPFPPHDQEESIRIAAEVLCRAREDGVQESRNVSIITPETTLDAIEALFDDLDHKRKRDSELEEDQNRLSEISSGGLKFPATPITAYRRRADSHSTPIGKPSILNRAHNSRGLNMPFCERSTPVTSHGKSGGLSSRLASPNTLICASALSLLSRKATSPQSLGASRSQDFRLSPSMTDRLLSPSPTSKIPVSPCGINCPPRTPDFKPFSAHFHGMESNHIGNDESPYRCKSAVHLLPNVLESYPLDSCRIPQISLPLYLFPGESGEYIDDDQWTRPVIDVKGFLSKGLEPSPVDSSWNKLPSEM